VISTRCTVPGGQRGRLPRRGLVRAPRRAATGKGDEAKGTRGDLNPSAKGTSSRIFTTYPLGWLLWAIYNERHQHHHHCPSVANHLSNVDFPLPSSARLFHGGAQSACCARPPFRAEIAPSRRLHDAKNIDTAALAQPGTTDATCTCTLLYCTCVRGTDCTALRCRTIQYSQYLTNCSPAK
jgi:hypothetical protein